MISALGHSYLLSRNSTYNGGLISKILSEITFLNNSNQLSVTIGTINIGHYIQDYFLKSTKPVPLFEPNTDLITNYETTSNPNLVTTIFGLIYIIVPCLICLLVAILWIIWKTIEDHPRLQVWRYNISNSSVNVYYSYERLITV